jgi:hypothetical protein
MFASIPFIRLFPMLVERRNLFLLRLNVQMNQPHTLTVPHHFGTQQIFVPSHNLRFAGKDFLLNVIRLAVGKFSRLFFLFRNLPVAALITFAILTHCASGFYTFGYSVTLFGVYGTMKPIEQAGQHGQ